MFTALLTDLVKVERINRVNEGGTAVPKRTTVAEQALCLIEERHGEVKFQGTTEALQFEAVVWFDTPIDLRPKDNKTGVFDRLTVIASDRIGAGTRFMVVHALSSPGRAHHIEAKLMRVAASGGDG